MIYTFTKEMNLGKFAGELLALLPTAYQYFNSENNETTIYFSRDLTAPELSSLELLILNHTLDNVVDLVGSFDLEELLNVTIDGTLADSNLLSYDSATSQWKNNTSMNVAPAIYFILANGETTSPHIHTFYLLGSEAIDLMSGTVSVITKQSSYNSFHTHTLNVIWDDKNLAFDATFVSNHGHGFKMIVSVETGVPTIKTIDTYVLNDRCQIYRNLTVLNTANITIMSDGEVLVL